jgi:hypothetical protein
VGKCMLIPTIAAVTPARMSIFSTSRVNTMKSWPVEGDRGRRVCHARMGTVSA